MSLCKFVIYNIYIIYTIYTQDNAEKFEENNGGGCKGTSTVKFAGSGRVGVRKRQRRSKEKVE